MFEIALTLMVVVAYFAGSYLVKQALEGIGRRKNASPQRALYISKVFDFGLVVLGIFMVCLVWGVDYSSLLVAASSTLAVIGVAFFAQWSILSNITASIVIFFTYPTRIGDRVRILDAETNTIEGRIVDINLFQVLIESEAGELINYPNNLIIQKPIVRLNQPRPEEESKES